jgi:hypothetical protein
MNKLFEMSSICKSSQQGLTIEIASNIAFGLMLSFGSVQVLPKSTQIFASSDIIGSIFDLKTNIG